MFPGSLSAVFLGVSVMILVASISIDAKAFEKHVLKKRALGRYEHFPAAGKYYKFHKAGVTWLEARRVCSLHGPTNQLAVPTTSAQYKALGNIIRLENRNLLVWVGISDIDREGDFKTINGQSLNSLPYVTWNEGEPNNKNNEEDCVVFAFNKFHGLNDDTCGSVYSFICEYPDSDS